MKAYQKMLAFSLVFLITSACIVTDKISLLLSNLKEEPDVEESTEIPVDEDDPCAVLGLTREECSNLGTHTYEFVTEFDCLVAKSHKIEKFTITFTESTAELHKIYPVEEEWTQLYDQVAKNEYLRKVDAEPENYELILEFVKDGFTVDSTLSDIDPCGKYIRTIVSD